jgi:hypothetical protein
MSIARFWQMMLEILLEVTKRERSKDGIQIPRHR